MSQSDDQGQLAVLSIRNGFINLIHEAYIESVWSQRSHRRKADGGISEEGQADAKSLVACL